MAEELKVVQAEVATLDTRLRERDEKMAELRTLSRQSPRPARLTFSLLEEIVLDLGKIPTLHRT